MYLALCAAWRVGRSRSGSSGLAKNLRFIYVIGRHLELHSVAGGETDEAPAHPSRNVSQHGCSFSDFVEQSCELRAVPESRVSESPKRQAQLTTYQTTNRNRT